MKLLLILSITLAVLGVAALLGSGYLAVNKYVLEAEAKPDKDDVVDIKIDTDRDGIPDQTEIEVYHTDPNKTDTDGDGYSDKTEIDNGHDPLSAPK